MDATLITTGILLVAILGMLWRIMTQQTEMRYQIMVTQTQIAEIRTALNNLSQGYMNHLYQYHGWIIPPPTQNNPSKTHQTGHQ